MSASVLLIGAVVMSSVQSGREELIPWNASKDIYSILQDNSLNELPWPDGSATYTSQFLDLVNVGGYDAKFDAVDSLDGDLCQQNAPKYTVFVPADTNIEETLTQVFQKTWSQILATPGLSAAIVADHVVNNTVSPADLVDESVLYLTARSGFRIPISDDTPDVPGDREVGRNVKVKDRLIIGALEACNGHVYGISGFIDSSTVVVTDPSKSEREVIWKSPSTPTSTRHLLFELQIGELGGASIASTLSNSDFENLGTLQSCVMTPIPENNEVPTTKYYLMVSCSGIGTFQPRLKLTSLEFQSYNNLTTELEIEEDIGGGIIDIVGGPVLSVKKTGDGQGMVESDISAIECGTLCFGVFEGRTRITLKATPEPGSLFVGWGGACSGKGACRLTLSAADEVTATFMRASKVLVTKMGPGTGQVTSTPGGVDCRMTTSATCSGWVTPRTTITLQARAERGSRFLGWVGACTGTASCTLWTESPGSPVHVFPIFERI